jgi:FkbM family methyltransferase
MWRMLKLLPPGLLTFVKRHTPFRLRLALRQALGADYRKIPDKIITVPDGRRFHIGPDLVYWAMSQGLEYEPEPTETVRRLLRPGDVVADVGANVGWYTTLCAGLIGDAGHVYAFEPVPSNIAHLRENIALNGVEGRVTVVEVALASAAGERTMHVFDDSSPALSSLSPLGAARFTPISVEVASLDEFVRTAGIKRIDFLKCDVEGGELEVLRGAISLLGDRDAPIVLIELNAETARQFGHTKQDILGALQRSGYTHFFDVFNAGTLRAVRSPHALDSVDLLLAGKDPQLRSRLASSGIRVKK